MSLYQKPGSLPSPVGLGPEPEPETGLEEGWWLSVMPDLSRGLAVGDGEDVTGVGDTTTGISACDVLSGLVTDITIERIGVRITIARHQSLLHSIGNAIGDVAEGNLGSMPDVECCGSSQCISSFAATHVPRSPFSSSRNRSRVSSLGRVSFSV